MTAGVEAILKFLGQGWVGSVINLLSVVLGIAAIIVTYVLYRRSLVGPRLAYHQRFDRMIDGSKPLLLKQAEIYFAGQEVQRLTKTLLVIWNYGTSTVHGSSVVSNDPIRFVFPQNALVLKPRVVTATRAANKLTVALRPGSPNEVICEFDYLDAKDGAVIEVFHTGNKETAAVLGSVRGIPTGLKDLSGAEHLRNLGLNPKIIVALVVYTLICTPLDFIEVTYSAFPGRPVLALMGLLGIVGVWVTGVTTLLVMKSRYPRQLREFFR